MNKKEFIDALRHSSDFPCELDPEAVCSYLESKLSDEVETDPSVFLNCMKLSFELFNHINEAEAQKHLDALATSIGEVMDSSETDKAESNEQSPDVSALPQDEPFFDKTKHRRSHGLWQRICNKKGSEKAMGIIAFSVVGILLLPFIAVAAALCLVLYAVPVVISTALMLAILVPTITLAVLAVIALSFGIAALFTSLPVGIMEIGLGTVLFSLTILLWALNLKFFTFIVPFVVSKITMLIKPILSKPISFVFGKEAK